jgi:agmatine deiminase
MINDHNTNFLYLADTLPKKHPQFYKRFIKLLNQHKITHQLIPNTKDIWCRDYMPIQNSLRQLISFDYFPDYLNDSPDITTENREVCDAMGLEYFVSYVSLDGGNVIHYDNSVIMCDKVIEENAWKYDKQELLEMLRDAFRANRVIFIPTAPDDLFGHADGAVRFVNSKLVLINKHHKVDAAYKKSLITTLEKAKLNYLEVPYNPYKNKNNMDATGCYLNFVQVGDVIFMPTYGLKEDDRAFQLFQKVFPKCKIVQVRSNSIAKQGGVLNCITWNVEKFH